MMEAPWVKTLRSRAARGWLAAAIALTLPAAAALAQQQADAGEIPPPPDGDDASGAAQVEMKPTEVGVRFTPGIANALSGQMTRQMARRYDLNTNQADEIQQILARQMMKLAQDSKTSGRDAVEFMMETMISNDGSFPADAAQKFAKTLKPVLPLVEKFFTESAGQIGGKMTLKQRLKFTADSAGAVAGLTMFKNRMAKWEKGEVGANANPFFDRPDNDPPAASNPNEKREIARARRRAEGTMQWQVEQSLNQWPGYVDRAIAYYELNESQAASAKAILKDCQARAAAIRTAAWTAKIKDNRMRRFLTFEAGPEYSSGPWMARIDREYTEMMKPLDDLYVELQRRIDGLPTTPQRYAAVKRARDEFAKLGVDLPGE